MLHHDLLYLLVPGYAHGDVLEFRELRGLCPITVKDRFTLEFEADFPDTLVRFDVELKPNLFDYATLYNQLSEYPSGEFVDIGPLDLAFTAPPRMLNPMLAVYLDGELYGKMWFEMPSVADVKARKLGGVFALEFPGGGRHRITIAVDEIDRERLNLAMVERITIHPDDRKCPEVTPAWDETRPWLLLGGRSVESLRAARATTHAPLWADMQRTVEEWLTTGVCQFRGLPMLASTAFMALLGDDDKLEQLIALLEARRERNAFLDQRGKLMFLDGGGEIFAEQHRWIMGHGWNDYGFAWFMLDYCCVYQWLGNRLPAELMTWIREKLVFYGQALYRFNLFQRQFSGGQGFYEAHSSVPHLANAVLGATLYHECPEAPRWLNFAVGRLDETLEILPEDGKADYISWGTVWFAQAVELLRDLTGRDERDRSYFHQLPTALWRTHFIRSATDHQEIADYYRNALSAFCASGLGDPAGQWYYQRHRAEMLACYGGAIPASYLQYLWHCADAGIEPTGKDDSFLFTDVSQAILQSSYENPAFAVRFQCGPTEGLASTHRCESYAAAAMGNTICYGGFEACVNGWPVIADLSVLGYGRYFRNGNFVCVDSDGFFLEGMYLVGRTDTNNHVAYLREVDLNPDLCYLDGITTGAYRPELGITLGRRQWLFAPQHQWALLVDTIESTQPHDFYANLHAAGPIETLAPGSYRFIGDQMPALVKHPHAPMGVVGQLYVQCTGTQPVECTVGPANMVLAYIFHVTKVKGGGTLTSDLRGGDGPPNVARLTSRAPARQTRAQFVTAISPHPLHCSAADGVITVATDAGTWQYPLDSAGLCHGVQPISRVYGV